MQRIFAGLAVVVLLLAGCAKEEEPVRQLFFPEYTVRKEKVTVPAWFYPETGEIEYLCPDCVHKCFNTGINCEEDVHGDACPFYKFSGRYSLAEEVLYYFTSADDFGDLYSYNTETRESVRLMDTKPNHLWRSSYIFYGEYLYEYDRDSLTEDGLYYGHMNRIHLPEWESTDIAGQRLPWKVENGTAYYLLTDSDAHIVSGIYSQPLYSAEDTPPAKNLILHEVELGSYPLLEEDAVYWIGDSKLRVDPDTVVHDLYRFDRKTQEIQLLAENFGNSMPVVHGDYLYAVRHDETRNVLMQVHSTDGDQKILYVPEDGWKLKMTTLEAVGKYLVVDAVSDSANGKVVYDTETGESTLYTGFLVRSPEE